uniref:Uncharacterized protein n=1 Tax=Triticum urartu TaxID=4572 RepID=A0A8R7QXV7_TRIUA
CGEASNPNADGDISRGGARVCHLRLYAQRRLASSRPRTQGVALDGARRDIGREKDEQIERRNMRIGTHDRWIENPNQETEAPTWLWREELLPARRHPPAGDASRRGRGGRRCPARRR